MNFQDWPQWAHKLAQQETDAQLAVRLAQTKPNDATIVQSIEQAIRVSALQFNAALQQENPDEIERVEAVIQEAAQPRKRGRPAKVK